VSSYGDWVAVLSHVNNPTYPADLTILSGLQVQPVKYTPRIDRSRVLRSTCRMHPNHIPCVDTAGTTRTIIMMKKYLTNGYQTVGRLLTRNIEQTNRNYYYISGRIHTESHGLALDPYRSRPNLSDCSNRQYTLAQYVIACHFQSAT